MGSEEDSTGLARKTLAPALLEASMEAPVHADRPLPSDVLPIARWNDLEHAHLKRVIGAPYAYRRPGFAPGPPHGARADSSQGRDGILRYDTRHIAASLRVPPTSRRSVKVSGQRYRLCDGAVVGHFKRVQWKLALSIFGEENEIGAGRIQEQRHASCRRHRVASEIPGDRNGSRRVQHEPC